MKEDTALPVSPMVQLKQEFDKRSGIIRTEMKNLQTAFLTIGFQLHWIKNNNMFRVLNYRSITEYAEKEFGIKKSTCSNFIQIIENYADRDADGNVIESLAKCYRNFSSSQLVAMLGMTDEQKQQITPDTSVRTINRIRKSYTRQTTAEQTVQENSTVFMPSQVSPKSTATVQIETVTPVIKQPQNPVQQHHRPVTLIKLKSYSDYENMMEKVNKLVKEIFDSGGQASIKLVCKEKQ